MFNKSTMATILGAAALGFIKNNSGSFNAYRPKKIEAIFKLSKKKASEITHLDINIEAFRGKYREKKEPMPVFIENTVREFADQEDFLGRFKNMAERLIAVRKSQDEADCETLSKIFLKLPNLEYLWLMNCQISRLPEDISLLQKIKYLNLRDNIIYELPDGFSNLKTLETLILDNNFLFDIPKQVFDLENLEVLSMSDVEIDKIPMSICNLKKLRSLSLRKINNPPTVSEIQILSKNLHPDVMEEILKKSNYSPYPPSQLRRF